MTPGSSAKNIWGTPHLQQSSAFTPPTENDTSSGSLNETYNQNQFPDCMVAKNEELNTGAGPPPLVPVMQVSFETLVDLKPNFIHLIFRIMVHCQKNQRT